jgi:DNA-binding response OmpR family regulator
MHILIVEDEKKIRDVVIAYIEREGWRADFTSDGHEAVSKFDSEQHDLVILDLKLEGLPGEQVCERIREKSSVPIIMLTSKSREEDTIHGLQLGADDYIIKPFKVKELIARIHALFRRIAPEEKIQKIMTFNKERLVVNFETKEVLVENQLITLTGTEFKLLSIFVKHPKKIFARSDLAYQVQGYRTCSGRTIDAHVKNLRKKVEADSKEPEYILTKIGSGYQFAAELDR